ncbi:DUF6011 domain-containing protein [Streptomyces sp. NPDC059740]|uniref:DUF6011 domain-containing protein n=1 Tax=Streptomyces sp. NPDC059740 TaxID=3346926 RepID=UPI003669E228
MTVRPDPQQPLDGLPAHGRRRVWCRGPGCHHELTDPESRRRGYGPTCDPERRTPTPATAPVDQDTLPGM